MIWIILLLLGSLLLVLGTVGVLYPWNGVSKKAGIILLLLFFISISMVPSTVVPTDRWEITTQSPDTSGWGQLSGKWNDNICTIPVTIDSAGNYRYNNTRIPFYVQQIPVEGTKEDKYYTITFTIENYDAVVTYSPFLKRTKGAFWANITSPDGNSSGNAYKLVYNMKAGTHGTFYIDFKLNYATGELGIIGERVIMPVNITTHDGFEAEYEIHFLCVTT